MGGSAKFAYKKIIEKVATSPRGAAQIQTYANKKFLIAKQDFLKNFDNHPATKSMEAGAESPETDYPVAGLPYGNLYAFVGIPREDGDVVSPVREVLENETVLITGKKTIIGSGKDTKIRINYSVRTPRTKLFEMTRLFFDNGLSWLYSLETGISGLSHFISKKLRGRSQGGVQGNLTRGGAEDAKMPYINELLKGLVAKFRSL